MGQIRTIEQLRTRLKDPNPLTRAKIGDRLDAQAIAFIHRSPFLLLSTVSPDGTLEVSPKGDEPGFVQIEDDRTILIPERPGNNLAFGLTNLLNNPAIGLILLAPATGETLRISGRATLHDDPALCDTMAVRGRAALLAIRVEIMRVYFHCARAILRAGLWEVEKWPAPMRVSFGRIIADATNAAPEVSERIDSFVDEGYRTGL